MRLTIILLSLFIVVTFFITQTTSFTTAEIKSELMLPVVSDEKGFIAIEQGNGKQFTVTNNSTSIVTIEKVLLKDEVENKIVENGPNTSSILSPGQKKNFNIKGDPKKLTGQVIQVSARWDGGSAEIESIID